MLGTPDHKDGGWLDNLYKYISQSGKKVEEIVKKYKSKMLIVTPLQVVSKWCRLKNRLKEDKENIVKTGTGNFV